MVRIALRSARHQFVCHVAVCNGCVRARLNDGYLWLGTWTGLFSFDGVRFTRFEPRAGEDLPAKAIRNLLATRDGSLWIVFTSGDIYRLREGERQHVMRGMRAEV